jgi:hypothetical protein
MNPLESIGGIFRAIFGPSAPSGFGSLHPRSSARPSGLGSYFEQRRRATYGSTVRRSRESHFRVK